MSTLDATALEIESLVNDWRSRLHQLDPGVAHSRPDPDRWSISEVIGHLIDSACNNHQRFVRAQFCEELVFPKYEQAEWVEASGYQSFPWESLIELWFHYNLQIAHLIRNIPDSKLSTPCTITPYETCTLGFLATDYLVHLQHHFKILADRILA